MTDRGQIPAKLYFRIGEVARIVEVEPHVLRYWETEFRSVRPKKSAKGQRVYSRKDVETLLKVRELLYAHRFTIEGAKRRLREGGVEPVEPKPEAAVVPVPVPAPVELPVAAAAAPRIEAGPTVDVAALRDELSALRGELVAFLDELGAA